MFASGFGEKRDGVVGGDGAGAGEMLVPAEAPVKSAREPTRPPWNNSGA
jgi:hypothetical protein